MYREREKQRVRCVSVAVRIVCHASTMDVPIPPSPPPGPINHPEGVSSAQPFSEGRLFRIMETSPRQGWKTHDRPHLDGVKSPGPPPKSHRPEK